MQGIEVQGTKIIIDSKGKAWLILRTMSGSFSLGHVGIKQGLPEQVMKDEQAEAERREKQRDEMEFQKALAAERKKEMQKRQSEIAAAQAEAVQKVASEAEESAIKKVKKIFNR
jgi:hypothetical protein